MVNLTSIKTVSQDNVKTLIEAANNYYNGRATGMTDYDYDTIMNSIKVEIPSFSIFDYVNFETDSVRQNHLIHIPTFEKVNFDRISSEVTSDIVLTPKYDGCSIVAYYQGGNLQGILTRSDEQTGIVQTNKLKNKVPNSVDPEIRAILFEALTIDNRAAANGLVNSKYKQEEVNEKLYLRPFDCILSHRALGYKDRMDMTGLDYTTLTVREANSLSSSGDEPRLYIDSLGLEVPVDGIVAYSLTLPDWGRIYKFYETDARSSVITKMHFDPSSDTGIVSICAEFEPVKIGSVNVKRCGNVGTWDTVKEKQLGVGSKVKVMLTKVTIPYIKENTPWTEEPVPVCPWCGSPYKEFQGRLVCENPDCGFWVDYFANKYFTLLKELKGSEWVDEITVKGQYGLTTIVRAELLSGIKFSSLLTNPKYTLFVLKPPRLTGKAYDGVLTSIIRKCNSLTRFNTYDIVNSLLESLTTDKQIEYVDMIWKKLEHLLRDSLPEIRRKLTAK